MTSHLMDIFPDVDVLAQLSAADLAPAVLAMAYHVRQDGKVHAQQILQQVHGPNNDHSRAYPQQKKQSAENSLNAAWNWLLLQGLLIPEPGFGGNSGWHVFSAEGEKLATTGDFESFNVSVARKMMQRRASNPVHAIGIHASVEKHLRDASRSWRLVSL